LICQHQKYKNNGLRQRRTKKLRESIAEKTRIAKAFANDKEAMGKLKASVESLAPALESLMEKSRYEKLTDEEQDIFDKIVATFQLVQQTLSDTNLLIFNDLLAKSHAYFFHVKNWPKKVMKMPERFMKNCCPLLKKQWAKVIKALSRIINLSFVYLLLSRNIARIHRAILNTCRAFLFSLKHCLYLLWVQMLKKNFLILWRT
jgi:hypothetical protein